MHFVLQMNRMKHFNYVCVVSLIVAMLTVASQEREQMFSAKYNLTVAVKLPSSAAIVIMKPHSNIAALNFDGQERENIETTSMFLYLYSFIYVYTKIH